jgi:hypothetical protein
MARGDGAMVVLDERSRWLQSLLVAQPVRRATLFERPPWNRSIRVSSASTAAGPFEIHGGSSVNDARAVGRLEVCLELAERRVWLADFEPNASVYRWSHDAPSPAPMLLSTILHDLKNSLGAQALLLGHAERELQTASDGSRSVRFSPLLESIALCRQSVALSADRAQLAQWLLSASAPSSMSGETWLRLAVAGLASDEREKLQYFVAPEARSGPRGDIRSLIATATALCAIASAGERTDLPSQPPSAALTCQDDQLVLKVEVPSRALSRESFWSAATLRTSSDAGRHARLVGIAELLASREDFSLIADRSVGTTLFVRAPRSSEVLR